MRNEEWWWRLRRKYIWAMPESRIQVTSHLGLLIPSYSSLVTHSRLQTCSGGFAAMLDDGISVSSAFPSRGRCPVGADRALAAGKTDEESGTARHIWGKSESLGKDFSLRPK